MLKRCSVHPKNKKVDDFIHIILVTICLLDVYKNLSIVKKWLKYNSRLHTENLHFNEESTIFVVYLVFFFYFCNLEKHKCKKR